MRLNAANFGIFLGNQIHVLEANCSMPDITCYWKMDQKQANWGWLCIRDKVVQHVLDKSWTLCLEPPGITYLSVHSVSWWWFQSIWGDKDIVVLTKGKKKKVQYRWHVDAMSIKSSPNLFLFLIVLRKRQLGYWPASQDRSQCVLSM